jgi:hypothetical protein
MYRQHVLRVLFLRRTGEIERTRLQRFLIHNHEFIVHNGVPIIDPHGDTLIGEERRCGVPRRRIALIHHDLDIDAALVRLQQCDGNRLRGERVRRDPDRLLRGLDGADDQFCITAIREKAISISGQEKPAGVASLRVDAYQGLGFIW